MSMQRTKYVGISLAFMALFAGALSGCGSKGGVFYEALQEDGGNAASGSRAEEERAAVSDSPLGEKAAASGNCAEEEVAAPGGETEREKTDVDAPPPCYVHICGAVMVPGVYEVPAGSRLYEVILLAGGMCADACDYLVNQAQTVSDGMQVYIPAVQEVQGDSTVPVVLDFIAEQEAGSQDIRVDINSATKEQLMTLPGVGDTRAQAILDYRRENGGFSSIEDLMKVNGIKQGVYDRLKDFIKV